MAAWTLVQNPASEVCDLVNGPETQCPVVDSCVFAYLPRFSAHAAILWPQTFSPQNKQLGQEQTAVLVS